jgi:endoglycosylceramidase
MVRARIAALAAGLSVASCGSSARPVPAPPASRTDPDAVHVVGRTFRDGRGRQLLFRGYNAKAAPVYDVTFDDGRTANATFTDFSATFAARLEQLGMNALRLPVNWSNFEPFPLAYSDAFLARIETVLQLAHAHHFYVIIDMHQDAYSKEIGYDGQPLWAIVPPPTVLLSGPVTTDRTLTGPALTATASFFANVPTVVDGRLLQDAYVTAVERIVTRFLGDPAVLGYEAYNEPFVLRSTQLDAFHQRFADGIHSVDRDAPMLFEPESIRNQLDSAITPEAPLSHGPGAYSPHVYTDIFSNPQDNQWASQDPSVLAPSMAAANGEATAWGTPLFVTEFGCDQRTPQGPGWISAELDLQDKYLASSTIWELSDEGGWGFYANDGSEQPRTSSVVSRTFPRAVAGDLVSIERPAPGHMLVHWRQTAETAGLPHEVSMSSDYATGYSVLCDGAPVAFDAAVGRATFTCPDKAGDRTFEVVGIPRSP